MKTARRRQPFHIRPILEHLEDRTAPAIWTGGAGGGDYNWSTPANWEDGQMPGVQGVAVFANNNVRSILDDGFVGTSILGIQIDSTYTAAFEVAKNTFTVSGAVTCSGTSSFTIDAGKTLTLSGDVTISGHRITNQ